MACILRSSALRFHDSQAYRKMDVTRERISRTLELREILLSSQTDFNLVNVNHSVNHNLQVSVNHSLLVSFSVAVTSSALSTQRSVIIVCREQELVSWGMSPQLLHCYITVMPYVSGIA